MWVEADPDRLGQVVANLVENASSFAEHQIVVGAGTIGGRPVVWVTDDGPGIPADQLAKVFERHFTSDRVSGRRKGSGLGLAIVSELASAMGASVGAQSPVADGHGTTMVVWMRAAARPEAARPEAARPASRGGRNGSTSDTPAGHTALGRGATGRRAAARRAAIRRAAIRRGPVHR